jgi:hypothetical protein
LIILQYADDTIIYIGDDLEKAKNLTLLYIYIYEMVSRMKINFLKNEIFAINGPDELSNHYAELFDCQVGDFPM